MPSYRGHVAAGCIVYAGAGMCMYSCSPHGAQFWAELFLFTLIGSLFPDVDTKSKGQQLTYALSFLLIIMLIAHNYVITAIGISLLCFIPLIGKHRGVFHDPLFLLGGISCALIILLHNFPHAKTRVLYDTLFFSIGVVSHIMLDRWIQPCKTKRMYHL